MHMRLGPLGWLLAIIAAACLAACGSSDKEGGGLLHGKSGKDKKPGVAAAADPTSEMSVAVSTVKGPSPVNVKFQMTDRPQPGQPLSVQFVLIPSATVQVVLPP